MGEMAKKMPWMYRPFYEILSIQESQQEIERLQMISAETAQGGAEQENSREIRQAFRINLSVGCPVNAWGVRREAGTT